jgi:hypothetical protein
MSLTTLIDQINSHKWLYLERLHEETDLQLCVMVDEAKVLGAEPESLPNASAYGQIVSDETCHKYRITFKNYIAYCVTNETCAGAGNEEQFTGTLFRTYAKSHFLDYIAASSNGVPATLGGYTHYEVVTLNQIIDVATRREPDIEIVRPLAAT